MADILTTTNATGSGVSTQNPQTVGQSSNLNGGTRNIQNSVTGNSLNDATSAVGIQLTNQSPEIVPVSAGTTSATTHSTPQPVKSHHLNSVAVSFIIVLVVAAAVIFIIISRSSKITTEF